MNSTRLTRGLYHKVVCESACALSQSASVTRRDESAELLLYILRREGYKGANTGEQIKDYLKKLSAESLCNMFYVFISLTVVLDGFVLEDDPRNIYAEGLFNKMPVMCGCVSEEGYSFLQMLIQRGTINDDVQYVDLIRKAIRIYAFKHMSEELGEVIVQKVAEKYRPENPTNESYMKSIMEIYANVYIINALYQFTEYHSEFDTAYLYELHYRPSFFDGASFIAMPHSQDQLYKFGLPFVTSKKDIVWTEEDKSISLKLMKNLGEFILTGYL